MVRELKSSSKLDSSQGRTPTVSVDWLARGKRVLINIFLIFNLVAITCWAVPLTIPLTAVFKQTFRPYLAWSGLFQTWDMFSPSPKSINSYVEAIIVYQDGNTRKWSFPRMEQLSLIDRYFKERYRKFVENLKEDTNSALWPDTARFIARLNNNRAVPVKSVSLVRYWSDIVPRADGEYQPSPWRAYIFYTYTVNPRDLN